MTGPAHYLDPRRPSGFAGGLHAMKENREMPLD